MLGAKQEIPTFFFLNKNRYSSGIFLLTSA